MELAASYLSATALVPSWWTLLFERLPKLLFPWEQEEKKSLTVLLPRILLNKFHAEGTAHMRVNYTNLCM